MSKILQEHVVPVGQQLAEAATVDTKQYSWGKLKTVSAGKSASVVLHPEHHTAIGKLKDGESHDFEDETRTKWKAERKGDNVHFTTPKISGKITAKHAHIAESVEEQTDVQELKTYGKLGRAIHSFWGHGDSPEDVVRKAKTLSDEELKKQHSALKSLTPGHGSPQHVQQRSVENEMRKRGLLEQLEEETDLSEALLLKIRDPDAGSRAHPDGDLHIKDAKKVGETPQGHHLIYGKYHYPRTGGGGGHKHRLFVVDKDHKKVMFSHHTNSDEHHKAAVKFAKNNHQGHWVHGALGAPGTQWHHEGERKPIISSEKVRAKKVVKEEVEQLEEAFFNHRIAGSQGIIHPNSAKWHKEGEHVDFYDHGTGDKEHGKVTRNDGKNIHILHKGKVKKYTISDTYKGHGDVQEEVELEEARVNSAEYPKVHADYEHLKQKSVADLLKVHKAGGGRVQSNYSAAEMGGKTGLISSILHRKHPKNDVHGYFNIKEEVELEEALQLDESLKALSDAAKKATAAYGSKRTPAMAMKAQKAHQAAYEAHKAQHEKKPLSNAVYNRMQEHGEFAHHYKRMAEEVELSGEGELTEGSLNARVWVKGGGYYTYQVQTEPEARKAHESSKNRHEEIVRIQMFDRPGKTKLQKEEVELEEAAPHRRRAPCLCQPHR
jgi:hypothetical protein